MTTAHAHRTNPVAVSTPAVSIVIPTHNRRDSLLRVLAGLEAQTFDMSRAEVIVVIDGGTDDTASALAARRSPLRLHVIEQPQGGVAVARNRGASAASAPVLIFMDDDVTPAPGFVESHLAIHGDGDNIVGLGRLSPVPGDRPPGWSRWLEWQLEKQYEAMLQGERAVDGRSLYSGNFSVSTATFRSVEGFDESQGACEDTDLGVRLQRAGTRFALSPDAVGYHGGYHNYESWQRTAYRDGSWDATLALKMASPFSWEDLIRDFEHRNPYVQALARRLLGRRRAFWTTIRLLRIAGGVAGFLRRDRLERTVYGGIYNLVYWQGVCDGIGGAKLLHRYLEAGR